MGTPVGAYLGSLSRIQIVTYLTAYVEAIVRKNSTTKTLLKVLQLCWQS